MSRSVSVSKPLRTRLDTVTHRVRARRISDLTLITRRAVGRPGRRDSASQLETMSRSRRLLGSRRARRSLRGPVDWAGVPAASVGVPVRRWPRARLECQARRRPGGDPPGRGEVGDVPGRLFRQPASGNLGATPVMSRSVSVSEPLRTRLGHGYAPCPGSQDQRFDADHEARGKTAGQTRLSLTAQDDVAIDATSRLTARSQLHRLPQSRRPVVAAFDRSCDPHAHRIRGTAKLACASRSAQSRSSTSRRWASVKTSTRARQAFAPSASVVGADGLPSDSSSRETASRGVGPLQDIKTGPGGPGSRSRTHRGRRRSCVGRPPAVSS